MSSNRKNSSTWLLESTNNDIMENNGLSTPLATPGQRNCRDANFFSNEDAINEGVTYPVKYIGCLEVKVPMKSLDFEIRSLVTKECIKRVCEAADLKSIHNEQFKRFVTSETNTADITRLLGNKPCMQHSGENVIFKISNSYFELTKLTTNEVIVRHDMPNISFASGGDPGTVDFVAYVAKNLKEWRACYVLECGNGLAQNIISTIGQAFKIRFREFLQKPSLRTMLSEIKSEQNELDYYNDLPGKVPPDMLPTDPSHSIAPSCQQLINFQSTPNLTTLPQHDYVNHEQSVKITQSDVFDMPPFVGTLWREVWYHGAISRQKAESLLNKDGDFLVRDSQGSQGQYVLTAMQDTSIKHLLLIDPTGVVRTRDRIFNDISDLINYHSQNLLPLISSESALVLRHPVSRQKK